MYALAHLWTPQIQRDICGNTSIINASIIFSAQITQVWCLGIVGVLTLNLNVDVINLKTSVIFSSSSGSNIGSIIGAELAKICSIQNSSVQGNIYVTSDSNYIGGFCGSQNYITTIFNVIISQMNISGLTQIGGFIGQCSSNLNLINSKIFSVRLSGSSYVGIVVGLNINGVYSFSGSSSTSNYINSVSQSDCGVLSNNWSVAGC
ncbi:Hypothetical_protein [Hexamita inflata]|uniref:Hypothetical_protein n=1 Tax=Hexamita inflata TaxID=28002 RepID=A0AA86PW01_9EUKA|nr:Hypothetical protein HINF_LOCUS29184 [Hexamita inflata]